MDCGGKLEKIPDDILSQIDFLSPNDTELDILLKD